MKDMSTKAYNDPQADIHPDLPITGEKNQIYIRQFLNGMSYITFIMEHVAHPGMTVRF